MTRRTWTTTIVSARPHLVLALALACACGGPPADPATSLDPSPKTPGSEPRDPDSAVAKPGETGDPGGDAADDPEESGADGGAGDGEPAAAPPAQREILYRMTPGGLVIEVEGASFLTTAKATKRGNGWVLRVEVEGSAIDGEPHRVLAPKAGPMAFAVQATRAGKTERATDAREGDDERLITPGDTLALHRDWPPEGGRVLGLGDSVKVEIGLWGVAKQGGTMRAVRKFALATMTVSKGTPKAYLTPPE